MVKNYNDLQKFSNYIARKGWEVNINKKNQIGISKKRIGISPFKFMDSLEIMLCLIPTYTGSKGLVNELTLVESLNYNNEFFEIVFSLLIEKYLKHFSLSAESPNKYRVYIGNRVKEKLFIDNVSKMCKTLESNLDFYLLLSKEFECKITRLKNEYREIMQNSGLTLLTRGKGQTSPFY